MNFRQRVDQAEIIDSHALSIEEHARCMADLAQLNRITGTHKPTLAWLERATKDWQPGADISILDVGFGHGDLLRLIEAWADQRGFRARLEGIDLNPFGPVVARQASPPNSRIIYRVGNVLGYRPDPKPDFIVSSQFTHHLTDPEVTEFLHWLENYAARGWINVDLERHVLPYYVFRLLAVVARWHKVIKLDGALSFRRSLFVSEWVKKLAEAGIEGKVSRSASFRVCVEHLR